MLVGISPIDPGFIRGMAAYRVLDHMDVLAVDGFPLDWNLWQIDEWPAKLAEIRAGSASPDTRRSSASASGFISRIGASTTPSPGCVSWADGFRPRALAWFDRQMEALEEFDVTATFCFTPEHLDIGPHHTSAPREPEMYGEFCAHRIARCAPGPASRVPAAALHPRPPAALAEARPS